MNTPNFMSSRHVPIIGRRIYIPRTLLPHYRDGAYGVITRSGWRGGYDRPTFMYVRLERPGNPVMKLYEIDWLRCLEADQLTE